MNGILRLIIRVVVTVGWVFRGSWTGGNKGGGQDVSERAKKKDGGTEKSLTRTWR